MTTEALRAAGRSSWPAAARILGALALLATGAIHLQQYFELYSEIPTIGTLFVLNFAGATVVGLGLLAPLRRMHPLLALAGAGMAATAFAFLAISERTPLFGFQEPGYDPEAILASRITEAAAVVLLGAFLAASLVRRR